MNTSAIATPPSPAAAAAAAALAGTVPPGAPAAAAAAPGSLAAHSSGAGTLRSWVQVQAINVSRHASALRPFTAAEFGNGDAAPSSGHIQAVNELITGLRRGLLTMTRGVTDAARAAVAQPAPARLQAMVTSKARAHDWVRGIERIWDFYFELFGQRQSPFAPWLHGCDRIATDCYQVAYSGIALAKSIPAPPPFCYVRTGFGPATWRRGIRMSALGRQLNPFPLVQLPYHRLVNPWTLAAVLHEVSHNLQSDLELSTEVPRALLQRLHGAGIGPEVARVWARWNREMFSDVCAALMGGPLMVGSIMDVVGREPRVVFAFNAAGVHPTPYFRVLINCEVLRRMGFGDEAQAYAQAWQRIYPNPAAAGMPRALLQSFPAAVQLAVDAMAFQPLQGTGGRSLAQVFRFEQKEQRMIEEAGRRLAAGNDPGIVPERFLIGAARYALNLRLASPSSIAANFYKELGRR